MLFAACQRGTGLGKTDRRARTSRRCQTSRSYSPCEVQRPISDTLNEILRYKSFLFVRTTDRCGNAANRGCDASRRLDAADLRSKRIRPQTFNEPVVKNANAHRSDSDFEVPSSLPAQAWRCRRSAWRCRRWASRCPAGSRCHLGVANDGSGHGQQTAHHGAARARVGRGTKRVYAGQSAWRCPAASQYHLRKSAPICGQLRCIARKPCASFQDTSLHDSPNKCAQAHHISKKRLRSIARRTPHEDCKTLYNIRKG